MCVTGFEYAETAKKNQNKKNLQPAAEENTRMKEMKCLMEDSWTHPA